MEERISGFHVEGDWPKVVDHGDRISRALRELGPTAHPRMDHDEYRDAVREWEDWRPRLVESYEEDVRTRTAEKASVTHGEGERRGREPGEDLGDASRTLVDPEPPRKVDAPFPERVAEACRLAGRAVDTGLRAAFRRIEELVYKHLMTRTAACYFDNRVVSANLERRSDDGYAFEVNINNDELKDKVSRTLDQRDPVEVPVWPSAA
jgi:hypothetical protein